MKIIRFDVELQGNRDVVVNGRVLEDPRALGEVEEKVIEKNTTLDQQWQLITMLKRMTSQLEHVYRKSTVRQSGGAATRTVFSGLSGMAGTNLPDLRTKK